MPTRVAIDAMGGDRAPAVVVEGAVEAVQQSEGSLHVLLVGVPVEVEPLIPAGMEHIEVAPASEVIGMDESPASAVKSKRDSSIHVGLGLVRSGQAEAFASAGNTGAVMAASLFTLGRIAGVSRPTIAGYYPTVDSFCTVLDVGANVDCKAEHLAQFAHMGSVYAERVLKRTNPSVALMNVGEEPGKGDEATKAAFELLSEATSINFIGNIEGRDLLKHGADVVICDGFVGNVMLKLGESIADVLGHFLAAEMKAQDLDEAQRRVVKSVLAGVARRFDYETMGGVPLLGVNGNVIIGHGGSTAAAITQMILRAGELVEHDVANRIAASLA